MLPLESSLARGLNLMTIVLLALLNNLCLLSFVNIHPTITSSGSKNDLPKLSIKAAFTFTASPDVSTVFKCKILLPIDLPEVDSK